MSGVCALVAGPEADAAAVLEGMPAMVAALARRGPDGARLWRGDAAALGHALLATTPEALVEAMPLHDAASGCTITADIRLDNREALLGTFGLAGEPRTVGDGELALRAWQRWGEDCTAHLLGDFAIVIHDPCAGVLFCARDPLGMRPLLWSHVPGVLFACASEAGALLAHPLIPQGRNPARIGDFLAGLEGADRTSTFHAAIRRLPPGHCLTLAEGRAALRRYWRPAAPPVLRLPDDEAYEAAFREVLTLAVSARLRAAGPVGVLLSGGVDSGSAAAIAARLLGERGAGPLHAFSVLGPDPLACTETRAIRAAQAMPGIAAHSLPLELPVADAEALAARIAAADEPFDGQMPLIWAAYAGAAKAGVRVVLDGVAADVVLGEGNIVRELIRRARWRQAWREVRARPGGGGFWRALAGAAAPASLHRWRRRRQSLVPALADPDFARAIGLAAREAGQDGHAADPVMSWRQARAHGIAHPFLSGARERYDRVAAQFAIEPRDPFMDLRVVEFCLSLPPGQVMRHGLRKWILRRAMRRLLPDEVTARTAKEHLGWDFARALLRGPVRHWWERGEEAIAGLRPYVCAEALAGDWDEGRDALEARMDLWHLACWLERNP